jgi:hypothetical protein
MGLGPIVKKTSLDIMQVVKRPAAVYAVGNHNLFTIVGGPVYIHGLFFYADDNVDLANAGTTMEVQICGVAADSAVPTAVRTLVGRTCVWPMNNSVPVPNLAMNIMPTAAGVFSALASPGSAGGNNITVAVATASTVGRCSWYVLYFRMEPNAYIRTA